MKKEDHLKAYEEHREALDWAVDKGIDKSQRIIGIHASRGIIELFSAFLHSIDAVGIGFQVNHRWFKSERVGERFPDFAEKDFLMRNIRDLELKAENLVYGSMKSENEIKEVLNLFNIIEKVLLSLIEVKDEK